MNQPEKRPIALEDLLRLKRAERPAPEFWEKFNRDLRTKQLAAIMEERPWWKSLRVPSIFSRGVRFYLPLSVAAALAVTLIVTRDPSAPVAPSSVDAVAVTAPTSAPTAPEASPVTDSTSTVIVARAEPAPVEPAADTSPAVTPASSGARPGTAGLATAFATAPASADTPSARIIAASLAAAQGAQGDELAPSLGLLQPRAPDARVRPTKVEPLAQIPTPASVRTNKILSARISQTMIASETDRSSERAARRLSDDTARVYDRGSNHIAGSGSTFTWQL